MATWAFRGSYLRSEEPHIFLLLLKSFVSFACAPHYQPKALPGCRRLVSRVTTSKVIATVSQTSDSEESFQPAHSVLIIY